MPRRRKQRDFPPSQIEQWKEAAAREISQASGSRTGDDNAEAVANEVTGDRATSTELQQRPST